MGYHTVLFDADNTLLDFSRSEREALADTLRSMQIEPREDWIEGYSRINDAVWKRLERGEVTKAALREVRFAEFCEAYGLTLDVPRMARTYTDFLSQKAFLVEGAVETCRRLSAHCRLYVITNGIRYVQERRFNTSPLRPYFLDVFISEEIGYEKPHAAYFAEVARRIPDFSPSDTLVVGDSLSSDIQGGVTAGLDTCWFNPRGKEAPAHLPITYTVTRLEDVVPLVLT